MKLGNKNDAMLIYRRRRSGAGPLPKGWKSLGHGAYRTCYLSPDGVVYKVAHAGQHEYNLFEFHNFKNIRSKRIRLPSGWRVPKVKLYSFKDDNDLVHVVAMQYVEGKHLRCPDNVDWDQFDSMLQKEYGAVKAFGKCGLWDFHEGNFMVAHSGKRYIIDLGE